MTAPDPKTVREIAREYVLDDRHRAHDIAPAILGRFGPDELTRPEYYAYCDAVRKAIKTATVTVSWPDEQQPAEATGGEQQQPWSRAQRMPLAVAGGLVQPWHYQVLAEYDAAHGTTTEPNSNIPGMFAAAQVNRAITWWNERVDAEQAQAGAAGEAAEGIARFLTHFREDSDDTVIEGLGRYCLTVGMLRAVLAEREADTRAVARCQRAKAGPDAVPAMLALDARFADRIAALNSTTTCVFPGCVHPDHQRNAAETEES